MAEQLQIYQISSILDESKYDENKDLNGSAIVESLNSAFLKLPKTVIVEEKEKKENNDDDLSSILLKLPKKIIIKQQINKQIETEIKKKSGKINITSDSKANEIDTEKKMLNEVKNTTMSHETEEHSTEMMNKINYYQMKQYVCGSCDFITNKYMNFASHKTFKHSERTHLCHQCDKKYFMAAHLKEHMEAVHETTRDCTLCNFKTTTNRMLRKHIAKKHLNFMSLVCTKCPFRTSTKEQLNIHESRLHTDKQNWPKCTECDYRSWGKGRMTEHQRKVHEGLRFQCQLCPAIFTRRTNMTAHMIKLHQDMLIENTDNIPTNAFFSERYSIKE